MSSYRLIAGTFAAKTGRVYRAGDLVESSSNLAEIFRGKFARVESVEQNINPSAPATAIPQVVNAPKSVQAPSTPVVEAVDKGRDVTKNFPLAVDEDFQVFKKDNEYCIYDLDNPDVKVNTVSLTTKVQVTSFIKNYLAQ